MTDKEFEACIDSGLAAADAICASFAACTPPAENSKPLGASGGADGQGVCTTRNQKNRVQWLSISEFLKVDPLEKLGLPGGWATGRGPACGEGSQAPAPGPEFVTPPSNTGVNKVGEVARVEQ